MSRYSDSIIIIIIIIVIQNYLWHSPFCYSPYS